MKKIQKIGFLFVLMLTCLVLVSCNTVKASDLIGVLMIEQEEGYVAEDFFVIGELKSGGETYPVTWTTDNDCLTVSSEKNAAGYYTVVVSRPEDEMQQVTLTATLTVAKVDPIISVTVKNIQVGNGAVVNVKLANNVKCCRIFKYNED